MRPSLLPKVKNWLNELGDIHHTLSHEQSQVQGRLKWHQSSHRTASLTPSFEEICTTISRCDTGCTFVDSEQAHEQVLAGDLELAF